MPAGGVIFSLATPMTPLNEGCAISFVAFGDGRFDFKWWMKTFSRLRQQRQAAIDQYRRAGHVLIRRVTKMRHLESDLLRADELLHRHLFRRPLFHPPIFFPRTTADTGIDISRRHFVDENSVRRQ